MASRMLAVLVGLLAIGVPGKAAEYRVASAADVARVAAGLKPGDTVVMAEGTWKDQAVIFRGEGTEEKPITLRAETAGKVILTGTSSVTLDGAWLVASGLNVMDVRNAKVGVSLRGRHCRLTESAVVNGTQKLFVQLWGSDNRVDHCYLAGKTSEGPTLQVEVEEQPNHHRIDHNHFGPRPPLGQNGGETIRIGYSHQSMRDSETLVEQNLFDRCDGELEIISNKSCANVYRANTFLDCAGTLTLRHGNRCLVDGNFFLGHAKKGTGGIRVIGEEHTLINNYIEGVERGGFWITAGIPNSPLAGYFQARDCLIAFNTIVDCRGAYLDLDNGIGSSERTLRPKGIAVAGNLLVLGKGATLTKGTEGEGWRWQGNISWAPAGADPPAEHAGVHVIDPRLERAKDNLWRPAAASPVLGAGEGVFAAVSRDVDGQSRDGRLDVGCDQRSDDPVVSRPLTAADVGPGWRVTNIREE